MSETRKCTITNQDFEISDKEIAMCKQLDVPLPNMCQEERIRTLMSTRNEWKLYRRKCDFTAGEIISAYPPDTSFTIYTNEVWWGNEWDATTYGRDYDFNRPFFEQFAELQKVVPREGTTVFSSENCDYNCHIRESKNCFLNSLVYQCEDLYYSYWCVHDKDVFDSYCVNESELCYNCISLNNSHGCIMVEESNSCSNCHFCYQCTGCKNCLFSTNLANKEYYIFNKQRTKEEFEEMKAKIFNGGWDRWQDAYRHYLEIRKNAPQRYVQLINDENCTGDHLYNSRNCENCYEGFDSEECVNCVSLSKATSIHSCYSAGWPDCPGPAYMSVVSRGCQDIAFCNYTWFSSNMRYSDSNNACDSCFGSIGLQHKKYCILNKQYTKEEYEELVLKIIKHMKSTGEWGQFFPINLFTYAYNESAAMDFYPLTKDEALRLGYKWRSKDEKEYQPPTISEIPNNINDVFDDFNEEILACEKCSKNYKVIKQELDFYRKMNLPIPRDCSECRHRARFDIRNPLRLFDRKCDKCNADMKTSYSPDRPEQVYCEECYLKEVY